MKKKIGIIGGGASGMVCAIVAAQGGCDVTLIEKNKKLGRKILATGNGRCNISNVDIGEHYYHGHHLSLVKETLKHFSKHHVENFFAKLGLDLVCIEDGRMFPMSLQSSSVVAFLEDALLQSGVKIKVDSNVKSLKYFSDKFIVLTDKEELFFDKVVISSGSLAMPSLGSSSDGYSFAKSFGHKIYPAFPSLVQLVSDEKLLKRVSGVKIDAILSAYVEKNLINEIRGDLLFTDYGLSGLAILDISRGVVYGLSQGKSCVIKIDLLPDISISSLKKLLQKKSQQFSSKKPALWLNGILHQKLVYFILEKTNLSHVLKLQTKHLHALAYMIKNLSITIVDSRGAKGAEVMAGGISCDEIDRKTFMSKLQKDLYFTGEVLDVDGDRGGYNLHFAWASGYLAGKHLLLK